jgi:rhamnose utilization protein RhaD (predicted bifunctional aldolase and dehydrogenase)
MLKELARMSTIAGARADYVQGGGGNTSVKLPGGLMAIKASGFRLCQVTENEGFAVVETDTLKDVTAEQGYKALRPSVEVGFHALLKTFVLHTHPVYANLALCSENGMARLENIMGGIGYITVPYINPGAELSAAIKELLKPETQAVFMINHGLVVTADTADDCLRLHDEINGRIAKSYGVTAGDFEQFSAQLSKTLYPDQQVYLTLTETQREIMAAVMFIHFTLMNNGEKVRAMDEKAMDFIQNWESEAYRKSILN